MVVRCSYTDEWDTLSEVTRCARVRHLSILYVLSCIMSCILSLYCPVYHDAMRFGAMWLLETQTTGMPKCQMYVGPGSDKLDLPPAMFSTVMHFEVGR